jgi:serine O-acetyltransferase
MVRRLVRRERPGRVTTLRETLREADDNLGLADIVTQLRGLRTASQKRRYRGAPPPLPSREIVVDLVDGLASAIYPRHFGPTDLAAKDVDAFVARTLHSALRALQRQIELELALAKEWRGERRIHGPVRAADLVAEFAAALPRVRALLDKDVRSAFEGDPSARSIDEIVFCFPGFAAILRHRLAHQLYRLGVTMIARIIAEHAHSETGIDIHPGAEIGEGFFIDHGTGVVIGETAVIGRSVRLYQMVTLGAKRFEADASGALAKNYPRHPIVEDDVVIYAGATVLGRVTIGKGSSIGGNVWLTRDVPPGSNITQAKARNDSFDGGGGI